MKYLLITLIAILSTSCASNKPINKEYEAQNIALVKNTIFDPIFSIKTKSTTLKAINGKPVSDKSSHEVPAGEHDFTASCVYYETSTFILEGTHTFKVNIIKGHTYKLFPVTATHKVTKKPACVILIEDLTKT